MSLPYGRLTRLSSNKLDPYSPADIYYGEQSSSARKDAKHRTFSVILDPGTHPDLEPAQSRFRRGSLDAYGAPRKFLIPVESTLKSLLDREDTDHNSQITIDDDGPKVSPTVACPWTCASS